MGFDYYQVIYYFCLHKILDSSKGEILEYFKILFEAVYLWISKFLWIFVDLIDKIIPARPRIGFPIVYGSYIIVMLSMLVLSTIFALRKKYRTSIYFIIIFLLMLFYFMEFVMHAAGKGRF